MSELASPAASPPPAPADDDAADSFVVDPRFTWTPASTRLAFAMLICVGQFLLWVGGATDPATGRGIEERLLTDGLSAFDAARAASGEIGAPRTVGTAWVIDLPLALLFRLSGVGLGPLRIVPGLCTLAVALFGGLLLRRRYGDAIGLIGAAALLVHGATFAWGRAPTVVPIVWAVSFGLLALGARRKRTAPWLALCLTSMATVLVHPTVAFIAPALVVEGCARSAGVRRILNRMPFPAAVIALVTTVACWGALPIDLRAEWVSGLLGAPSATAPPLFAIAPVVLVFAWAGALLFLGHVGGAHGGNRRLERLMHGAVWIPLALRASVGSIDAAACAELLPILIWLAVATFGQERGRRVRRSLPFTGARGAALCFVGVLGTLTMAAEARAVVSAIGAGDVEPIGLALPWVGLALILALGLPAHRRPGRRGLAMLATAFLVVPGLWESTLLLGHGGKSWSEAARHLEGTVLPTHRVGGAWARVASVTTDLPWGGDPTSWTHRLAPVEEADGGQQVGVFSLIGRGVVLDRLDRDDVAMSAFEEGRSDEAEGRVRDARRHYFLVLRADPDHAPSWERIAATLIAEGDRENAYRCLMNALHGAPASATARRVLASLYLDEERLVEARHHLERAGLGGATRDQLAPLIEELDEASLR